MGKELLMRYLKLVIESMDDFRVSNQLIDLTDLESKKSDVEDVNEFSGVGMIAGFTAPLGVRPDVMGNRQNMSKRRKKKH